MNINGKPLINKLNIALFESWMVNLAKRDRKVHESLIENQDYLVSRYAEYFQLKEFHSAISSNTSSIASVNLRFGMISDLIDNSI
ncbi:hypothetical protein D3C86_1674660 [compost metagenome]